MRHPKAYLVTVREFVLIAADSRDVRELVAEAARDDHQAQLLTAEELSRWGGTYPVGLWDPDRELTCAEIAAEMGKATP
jgi:hypothetical protein